MLFYYLHSKPYYFCSFYITMVIDGLCYFKNLLYFPTSKFQYHFTMKSYFMCDYFKRLNFLPLTVNSGENCFEMMSAGFQHLHLVESYAKIVLKMVGKKMGWFIVLWNYQRNWSISFQSIGLKHTDNTKYLYRLLLFIYKT